LSAAGIKPDDKLVKVGNFKIESGYRLAVDFINSSQPPTAIFAANNLMTLGALRAMVSTRSVSRKISRSSVLMICLVGDLYPPSRRYRSPPTNSARNGPFARGAVCRSRRAHTDGYVTAAFDRQGIMWSRAPPEEDLIAMASSDVIQSVTENPAVGTPVILSMKNITKRFPGVLALDNVSLDIHAGEVHGLVGENGAGKSTLMNILSGVYTSFDGQIQLNEHPVNFHNTREAQHAGIAMIHQELNLVPELTVYENILLGREHKIGGVILNRPSMRRAARKLMSDLGLDIDTNRPINRLRVGQRQLIEIAKALSLNARILIMDEPTSALSEAEVEYLFKVIRGLRAHNVAVIYISHRLDEIFFIADRITVLRDGRVVGTSLAPEITRQQLINLMVGRNLENLYPRECRNWVIRCCASKIST